MIEYRQKARERERERERESVCLVGWFLNVLDNN